MQEYYPTYSPAKGDFNGDGYSDIAVQSRSPHKPLLLMNQNSGNRYIKVTPHGTVSNKQAVGAWIRAYFGESSLSKYTVCGENYLGQNSQHIIFGAGESTDEIDSLTITHTSGHTDTYYNLPTDSVYHFYEGETYYNEIESPGGTSFCQGDTLILDAGLHYSYYWNTGDTTRYLAVNEEGSYTVTTTNTFGIETDASIEITRNPLPNLSTLIQDIACTGDSSGSIFLQNQTGVAPENVLWNNGFEGDSIYGLNAGTYEFYYTDSNGCSDGGSVTLSEPDSMILIINTAAETTGEGGGIFIAVFGGTPPFQVLLDGELAGVNIQGLSAGSYLVTVIDANGCTKSREVTIEYTLNQIFTDGNDWAIFPNPVENTFGIRAPRLIKSIQINDVHGKKIKQLLANTKSNKYDISFLPTGVYIVRIIGEDFAVAELRLIKN